VTLLVTIVDTGFTWGFAGLAIAKIVKDECLGPFDELPGFVPAAEVLLPKQKGLVVWGRNPIEILILK